MKLSRYILLILLFCTQLAWAQYTPIVREDIAGADSTKKENFFMLRKDDGGSILDAVEFMYPYIADKGKWFTRKDVKYFDYWPVKQNALYLADAFCGKMEYMNLWKKMPDYRLKFELVRNYPVRNPELWII